MASKRTTFVLGALALITCVNAYPQNLEQNRQPRQDEDESNPINFGAQVAQIITGVFTGNLDSIIKGSFGFIPDPNVNQLSHNTWETLKGNPTQRPLWLPSTTPKEESEPESPSKEPPTRKPPPPTPTRAAATSPPVESHSAPIQSAPKQPPPDSVYAPDVYAPGSSFYPTRAPTRTTQPTYATLAPLSVIEGTGSTEPEAKTTIRTTTEDDDDIDEAEGFSSSELYRL